ncbi:MAG: FtsX-like permease family protein [Cyanobacteriota bacterium]
MKNYIFNTYFRILKRDKAKIIVTFLSLLIGAFVLSVVLGLIGSVRTYIFSQSKELIGGDIVLQQSFPIEYEKSKNIKEIIKNGAVVSKKMETMVNIEKQASFFNFNLIPVGLVSLKIVSENYPLYGQIETKSGNKLLPKENEIYAEKSFFEKINVKLGETVKIGSGNFIVSELLEKEPDSFGAGLNFMPKVIMTFDGWKKTGIDKNFSRISNTISIKITNEKDLPKIDEIEKEFIKSGANVTTSKKGPTQLIRITEAWKKAFLTITVLTLFLIMINVRTNLSYLAGYFTKTIAVFKVLGMKNSDISIIFTSIILTISILASFLGNMVGNLFNIFIITYIEKTSGVILPKPFIIENILLISSFILFLALFSYLPVFFKLIQIKPKTILSQPLKDETKLNSIFSEIIISLLTGIGLFLGIYYLTQEFILSLISVFSLTIVFSLLILGIKFILLFIYKKRFSFNFTIRSIINFVKSQGFIGETALATLTLSFMGIFTIALIQNNLEQNLKGPLTGKTPNVYVLDVREDQVTKISKYFTDLTLYPNVRARLVNVDKNKIQEDQKMDPEFKREFNLTYRTKLIDGEKLTDGVWHENKEKGVVSVENKFAKRLGLKLGSELEFLVAGIPIKAKVTSFRKVDSSQGLPFFFFVFSPDLIESAPKSFFGFSYTKKESIPSLQSKIVKDFPNVFIISRADVFNTIQTITNVVLNGVLMVSLPSLILGIILLFSMIVNSARERFRELLLFKIFGSEKKFILKVYLSETLFFIIISSILGGIFSFIITYAVNEFLFKFEKLYLRYDIFLLTVFILFFNTLLALYLTKKQFAKSPSDILRE